MGFSLKANYSISVPGYPDILLYRDPDWFQFMDVSQSTLFFTASRIFYETPLGVLHWDSRLMWEHNDDFIIRRGKKLPSNVEN